MFLQKLSIPLTLDIVDFNGGEEGILLFICKNATHFTSHLLFMSNLQSLVFFTHNFILFHSRFLANFFLRFSTSHINFFSSKCIIISFCWELQHFTRGLHILLISSLTSFFFKLQNYPLILCRTCLIFVESFNQKYFSYTNLLLFSIRFYIVLLGCLIP